MDPATLSIVMRPLAPAALLEGPATAAGAEAASLVRGRER